MDAIKVYVSSNPMHLPNFVVPLAERVGVSSVVCRLLFVLPSDSDGKDKQCYLGKQNRVREAIMCTDSMTEWYLSLPKRV